jgi:arylsulfatase A-like enzyme
MKRGIGRRLGGLLLAAFLPIAGCNGSGDRPNLVLITVDTLRPDHLGFAGYHRDTSPVADRLAAEGVVFHNSYSQAGWTLPAIATIFTGHHPKDHGSTDFNWALDGKLPTLAGVLRRNGYETHGYVSHVVLRPKYGVADGFSTYDFSVLNVGNPHFVSTARELTDLAIAGLEGVEPPYFLWIHYFDPHFEYVEHRDFASFGNDDIDRYDQEIAHTDYHIGRLLANLPDVDNTAIVFTSDHGEEFGEHDGAYHYTLFEEVLRVPLIINAPSLEPGSDRSITQQIDLLPTMLSLVGIPAPEGLPGRDLLDAQSRGGNAVFIERDNPHPWVQRGVIRDGLKLIYIEEADSASLPPNTPPSYVPVTNVQTGTFLFELNGDPGELNNLFDPSDSRALDLLGLMTTHFSARKYRETAVKLDEELLEKLRSLGYVE